MANPNLSLFPTVLELKTSWRQGRASLSTKGNRENLMDWSGTCIRPHIHIFADRQGLSTVTSLYPVPLIYWKDKLGLLLIDQSNKWFGNFSFHPTCNLSLNLFLSFKPGEQPSTDTGKALSRCWPNSRRVELMLVRTWSRGALGGRLGMLLVKITAYGESSFHQHWASGAWVTINLTFLKLAALDSAILKMLFQQRT